MTVRGQCQKASRVILGMVPTILVAGVAMGTGVLVAQQPPGQSQVTFARDIAPILQRSCQNCHNSISGIAPMPLTTYEEVRPWARSIKLRTARREMPPWYIEKNIGIQRFKDDISLSDEEIARIAAWVDAGAPRGNPADMPPPRQFLAADAWSIGEPDLILSSPVITVKAVGGDEHPFYVGSAPTGLTEDRWIESFEVREVRRDEKQRSAGRPGGGNNYFAVHHQAISTVPPGADADQAEGEARADEARRIPNDQQQRRLERGEFGYTYEVGQNGQRIPPDGTIALKAGSTLYFTGGHFHSIGKEVRVQVEVGFKFHPRGFTPKYPNRWRRTPTWGIGAELDIPGNTDNVMAHQSIVLQKPRKLVSFEPHLHAGGKRMCAEAYYPNGMRETLNCSGYNHAWVKSYVYEDDYAPLLPKGTIIHFTAWYDNTAKNPRVVDPRNWRGMGQRSIDEMFLFLGKWVEYTDEEFEAEVAARKAKQAPNRLTTAAANNQP